MSKVFGIGAHKTGTTTLEFCLAELGYLPQAAWANSAHMTEHWLANNYMPIFEFAEDYASFSDSPWNYNEFYQHLDEVFPGSKFVLTVRDPDAWFDSLRSWCTPRGTAHSSVKWLPYGSETHLQVYHMPFDCFDDYRDHYKFMFQRRNWAVQQYFKDRPDDLLVVDWTQHGWVELCKFLDKPVPNKPLPHVNIRRTP